MWSTTYYPQGNIQVKVSNKTIIKIHTKNFNDVGCDQHAQLNSALWAYHTSICTPQVLLHIHLSMVSQYYQLSSSYPLCVSLYVTSSQRRITKQHNCMCQSSWKSIILPLSITLKHAIIGCIVAITNTFLLESLRLEILFLRPKIGRKRGSLRKLVGSICYHW